MLTLSLASREIWWRNTCDEVISLSRNIGRVGLGNRTRGDIHNARVTGSVVYFVDGVNGCVELDH